MKLSCFGEAFFLQKLQGCERGKQDTRIEKSTRKHNKWKISLNESLNQPDVVSIHRKSTHHVGNTVQNTPVSKTTHFLQNFVWVILV